MCDLSYDGWKIATKNPEVFKFKNL